jgi:hypothetical protein
LSFSGRVDSDFDSLVFQGCEESIDAVGVLVGRLGVGELGVDESLGDSLLSREGLLALEPSNVDTFSFDGMRDSLVYQSGRVVHVPCALLPLW